MSSPRLTWLWCAGLLLVISSLFVQYNATPSIRTGIYFLTPFFSTINAGDVVGLGLPPEVHMRFQQAGFALEPDIKLIKNVAATAGDKVCVTSDRVTVNGAVISRYQDFGLSHLMRKGCDLLGTGHVFIMGDTQTSLDGRFLGITDIQTINRKGSLMFAIPAEPTAIAQ